MQEGNFSEIDKLGCRLNVEIDCPVRFPGNGKNTFTCKHGCVFPVFRLKGGDDWSWTKKEHEQWLKRKS